MINFITVFKSATSIGHKNELQLTDDAPVSLEDLFHIDLVHLKCVQIAHEDPRVDRMWILGTRLVPHFAHVHFGNTVQEQNHTTN